MLRAMSCVAFGVRSSRGQERRLPCRLVVALLATALLASGCAGHHGRGSAGGDIYGPGPRGYMVGKPYRINGVWYYPAEDKNYDKIGFASWYGPGFHGRRTANGERYDRRRLTAAHTTLPMPVIVRVTNLKSGRSVILRVNDRGPFMPGRIIDVSEAAAKVLGFRQDGLARVRVQFVSRADGPAVAAVPPSSSAPAGIPTASAAEATGATSFAREPAAASGSWHPAPSNASTPSLDQGPVHHGTHSHNHARFLVEMR